MEKLWTVSEAAQTLGLSDPEVERLVKEGKLTAYKLGGRFLRFRPEQVESLRGRVAASPQPAKVEAVRPASAWDGILDFFYFNDFILFSVALLIALAGYILWVAR